MRQPMVTSLGILLGFLLNFLAGWATEDHHGPTVSTAADYSVAASVIAAIVLMCVVLMRLLDPRPSGDEAPAHYRGTYRLYCIALPLASVGVAVGLFV